MQKVLHARLNSERLKIVPTVGSSPLVGGQRRVVKSISSSVIPKAGIRYVYYLFIFSLPFEGAIGGLSHVGLVLLGLTVFQPRLFFKAPRKHFGGFSYT